MELCLVTSNGYLLEKYRDKCAQITNEFQTYHPASSIDLYAPLNYSCYGGIVNSINMEVRCYAKIISDGSPRNSGFFVVASSMLPYSKLRLANGTVIARSDFHDNIICAFDCIAKEKEEKEKDKDKDKRHTKYDDPNSTVSGQDYMCLKGDSLVKICSPCLLPLMVHIYSEDEWASIQ